LEVLHMSEITDEMRKNHTKCICKKDIVI